MPLYHVGSNEIALKKGLKQDDYLASLHEDYDPSNPRDGETIFVFDSLDKAMEAAGWGRDKADKNQLPIFTVELAEGAKKKKADYKLEYEDGSKPKKLSGFDVNETDVTLTEAAFPHINKTKLALEIELAEAEEEEDEEASNEDEVEVEAEAEVEAPKGKKGKKGKKEAEEGEEAKPEAAKQSFWSKIVASVKAYWPHVTLPTAAAAGVHFGGLVPAIISQLPSTIAATLPAGIAGSGLVAGVAGIAAYAGAYALWSLANKAYGAYQKSKRTDKQKHDDEVAGLQTQVADLEKALGLKDDNSIVVKFAEKVERAADDTFKEDGKLNKAAPAHRGKVHVLQWEVERLKEAKAAKDEDREEILSKAKNARGLRAR